MTLLYTLLCAIAVFAGQAHPTMPPDMTHEEHQRQMAKDAELKRRGADAMGFDQDKATHHFRLTQSGGAIEVAANDPADADLRASIRTHLEAIAASFANGVFDQPLATHGEMPPGVGVMVQRKKAITYSYEETAAGGRVRIESNDSAARQAVHEFLRYQIREHRTGDSLQIGK